MEYVFEFREVPELPRYVLSIGGERTSWSISRLALERTDWELSLHRT